MLLGKIIIVTAYMPLNTILALMDFLEEFHRKSQSLLWRLV